MSFLYDLRALGNLLVPVRCLVCGRVLETPTDDELLARKYDSWENLKEHLCPECREDLPLTWFWSWGENPAEERLWHRVGITAAASLFFYRQGSGYARLVQEVKYSGNLKLGRLLGSVLGEKLRESGRFSEVRAVAPVPLHRLRRWRRGYNQAEVIGLGVAEKLGVPLVPDLLIRSKYTGTQTKLDAEGKRDNVSGAFKVSETVASTLVSQGITHILVIDDVLTSGSTLSAAVAPLLPRFRVSAASVAIVE